MEIKDVKDWIDNGKIILNSEKIKELNSYEDKNNITRFRNLYYDITDSSFNIEYAKTELIRPLHKRLRNISSSDFKTSLTSFISFSKRICESEDNLTEFRKILKDNNLSQWKEHNTDGRDDINILLQRLIQEQEAERRRQQQQEAERRRQQQQQEEAERLRRQQQERERQEREEAERRRYLEYLEEQRLKKRKRSKIILNSILIAALLFATMKLIVLFRDINYCNKIIIKSEQLADNYQYEDAIKVLSEAKEKISFSNKKKIVVNKIADIESERDSTSSTLRDEINQIWDTYFLKNKGKIINSLNKNVIKYVSKNDIKPIIDSTSEKVELLKNISNDQQEYKDNMVKINVLKNHYKIQ